MRKPLLLITIFLLIVGLGVFIFSKGNNSKTPIPSPEPGSYEYFWGDGCPHCAKVAEFLNSWDGKDNIKLQKFEVWKSAENAKIMQERASNCGINPASLGVPLLFTPEGRCIIGDAPIIEFFQGLTAPSPTPENGQN